MDAPGAGHGEFAFFKVDDFAAYERQTRQLLASTPHQAGTRRPRSTRGRSSIVSSAGGDELCANRRSNDDDLSLVTGMTTGQRRALKGAGISTRRGFARLADSTQSGSNPDVLERAQRQARLQVGQRGRRGHPLRDPGSRTGRRRRPSRQSGTARAARTGRRDLFFDIEGARYYSENGREFGLQYLFSVVDTAEADEAGLPGTRRFGPMTGRARSVRSRS